MTLDEAFDVLRSLVESTAATRHVVGGRGDLRDNLKYFSDAVDKSTSERDMKTYARLINNLTPAQRTKYLLGGKADFGDNLTPNEQKAADLGSDGLLKAMAGRMNAMAMRKNNKPVNASADMLREACLTILAAIDESAATKSQEKEIKRIGKEFVEEFAKKNDKKLEFGSFKSVSFGFDKELFWINFEQVTQDDFFKIKYEFWEKLAKDLKNKFKDVVKISRTTINDDCPCINFIY